MATSLLAAILAGYFPCPGKLGYLRQCQGNLGTDAPDDCNVAEVMLAQPLRAFSRVRCVATSPHTANTHIQVAAIARIQHQRYQSIPTPARTQCRHFSISTLLATDGSRTNAVKDVQQQNADPEESDLDRAISQEKEKQTRAPWHREGSNVPPVARQRSAGAMTKGMVSQKELFDHVLIPSRKTAYYAVSPAQIGRTFDDH